MQSPGSNDGPHNSERDAARETGQKNLTDLVARFCAMLSLRKARK
jgi:hypothetical protein